MSQQDPGPWNFENDAACMASPDGIHAVMYGPLYEIAMGGPVSGACYLSVNKKKTAKLYRSCGGPPAWDISGKRVAFPVWTNDRMQRMCVADLETKTVTIYEELFRVLDLKAFEYDMVFGYDSPIHDTSLVTFHIPSATALEQFPIK